MALHAPAVVPQEHDVLNLDGMTEEERDDFLARRELYHNAIAQGMQEVKELDRKMIADGLMDENHNLLPEDNQSNTARG